MNKFSHLLSAVLQAINGIAVGLLVIYAASHFFDISWLVKFVIVWLSIGIVIALYRVKILGNILAFVFGIIDGLPFGVVIAFIAEILLFRDSAIDIFDGALIIPFLILGAIIGLVLNFQARKHNYYDIY